MHFDVGTCNVGTILPSLWIGFGAQMHASNQSERAKYFQAFVESAESFPGCSTKSIKLASNPG